jgi:MFS family permease
MARVRHRWAAADSVVRASLGTPRDDLLTEQLGPDGAFHQAAGPFLQYRRQLDEDGDGVVETTEYVLKVPWWGWIFGPLVRKGIRRAPGRRRTPWWAPPDHLDARAISVLSLLAAACLAVGYLNTLFTQTVNFAADEFGASEEAQGVAGTFARFGIVFSLPFVVLADRVGRKKMLVAASVCAPVLCALGAAAPSFVWLTVTQTLGRPVAIALGLIVGIVAAEEMPRNSRAYAVSLLALATGLGAGFAVMALPLADLGVQGWRLVYVLSLAFLIVAVDLARRLPESRRFVVAHPAAPPMPRRRFLLLAASGFALNVLVAPASFFQNRYLKDVRGYSASFIALFTLATNTPGGAGIILGGRLADLHGRRVVAMVAVVSSAALTVVTFYVAGLPLWVANGGAAIMSGAYVPALGVYTSELFPTGRRGVANGLIASASLLGSGAGLLVAGSLLDGGMGYGPVMALLAIGPLAVAVMVAFGYPETAHLTLEQLNPEDERPPGPDSPPVSPEATEEGRHR